MLFSSLMLSDLTPADGRDRQMDAGQAVTRLALNTAAVSASHLAIITPVGNLCCCCLDDQVGGEWGVGRRVHIS